MKKNKKLLSLAAVAAMSLTVIGGSLAYFTDVAEVDNEFTSGKVDIELYEMERAYDTSGNLTGLVDLVDDDKFFPVVANGGYDEYGLSTDRNYVDKIITVKNLEEDAYVRVFTAIPTALENLNGNASYDVLHMTFGETFVEAGGKADGSTANSDFSTWTSNVLEHEGVTIAGHGTTLYNIYSHTYERALTKDETTASACVTGLYLDSNVDHDGTNYIYKAGTDRSFTSHDNIIIDFDLTDITIPVYVQAVQAAGFDTADAAFDGEGFSTNPWADTAVNEGVTPLP